MLAVLTRSSCFILRDVLPSDCAKSCVSSFEAGSVELSKIYDSSQKPGLCFSAFSREPAGVDGTLNVLQGTLDRGRGGHTSRPGSFQTGSGRCSLETWTKGTVSYLSVARSTALRHHFRALRASLTRARTGSEQLKIAWPVLRAVTVTSTLLYAALVSNARSSISNYHASSALFRQTSLCCELARFAYAPGVTGRNRAHVRLVYDAV
eukprot:1454159-Pleurochrysis_carterae.AAC.2